MVNLNFKKANINDLELLVQNRVNTLRIANGLNDSFDMSEIERTTRSYYLDAIPDGRHIEYLAFDGEHCIACGAISIYNVMPTCHDPSGKKAYVMNVCTHPEYRRQGIAGHILELLIKDCEKMGIRNISLEATQMGRGLYEKHGFVELENEMEYVIPSEE